MIHHYQKRWVFTWNADHEGNIIEHNVVQSILNNFTSEAVFQLEVGKKTGRLHYQGRFTLIGPRLGKKRILELFSQETTFSFVQHLTVAPEKVYDSSAYCTKLDTRKAGPWFAGLESYTAQHIKSQLTMKIWQEQFLELVSGENKPLMKDRKVIWIEDKKGGAGKSQFIKYLTVNKPDGLIAEKLPFDKPDRTRSAVVKLMKRENVDLFMFDFTRTRGKDTSLDDLFEAIEEIKNGYVIDTMYGKYEKVIYYGVMVVIFTNEDFGKYKDYLSADRWVPFSIVGNSLYHIEYEDGNKCFYPYPAWSNIKKH